MIYKNLNDIKKDFIFYLKNHKNIDIKKNNIWEMSLIKEWINKNCFFVHEDDIKKLISNDIIKLENLDILNQKNKGEIKISKLILICLYESLRDSFYENEIEKTKK